MNARIHSLATPSLALGLLLAISMISVGCAARTGEREEIPHSSRDQFAQQLDLLDERIELVEDLSADRGDRSSAVTASLVRGRAEVVRRLEELDEESPTFAADRQLVEDELFQLEADVAHRQRELQRPVRAAHVQPVPQQKGPGGREPGGATGG
jgi:hypothetical protein